MHPLQIRAEAQCSATFMLYASAPPGPAGICAAMGGLPRGQEEGDDGSGLIITDDNNAVAYPRGK